jgi:hypothetical protein
MALSGSFSKNVNTHWRVRATWSGSQSISGNYTDITLRVYWESTDSYGTTYTSATKSGRSYIDGTREDFTFSAKLSGKDSTLVNTQTKRVYHADDGRKSISLSATLDVELDISGWVGSVTISDSATLDTIPRASSMSSSASWTAGSNRTINLNLASSGFNHEVEISVKRRDGAWDWIKRVDFGSGDSSQSTSFSTDENTEIFRHLDGRSSCDTRMVVQTFSGSTMVGEKEYNGTVTAPEATQASIDNPTGVSSASGQGHSTVWIDQTINLSLPRKHGSFTHTVRFKDRNGGNTLKTLSSQGTSSSWTPNSTEQNTLYSKTPNSIEFDGQIEVDTFYNGVQVRTTRETDINFRVRNANPTFSATQVTYKDINSSTVALTTNDQLIVQGKSTFRAWVNSVAQAQKGASIDSYVLTINGQTASVKVSGTTDGVGYYSFTKPINASSDQTLTIKVTDSRGLSVTVTKNVTVIPYEEPKLNITAKRANSFGETVTLRTSGTFSSVNSKNILNQLQYRYKEKGATTWIRDWTNISVTPSGTSFTGANITITMDVVKLYDIEVQVGDALTSGKKMTASVGAGQPIFFIDADMRAMGFNDFPSAPDEFKVNGRIVFGANQYASTTGSGEGFGALWLNNSDIGGVNGIFMHDSSNNDGEGILFLKNGKETGSTVNTDYFTFRINGDGYVAIESQSFLKVDPVTNANEFHLSDGTVNRSIIRPVATGNESHGLGFTIGAGGLVAIGSGESAETMVNGLGWAGSREDTFVTSDNWVYVSTNLNGGYDGRQSFSFTSDGDLNVPRQVNSGSNLRMNGYNTIENLGSTLYLRGAGAIDLYDNAGTDLVLHNDGKSLLTSMATYNRTYSGSANMFITGYGTLGRVTSALKYKTSVKEVSDLSFAERVLELQPKSWIDKNQSYEKMLKDMGVGEFVDAVQGELPRHFGLIAEDVEAVGLPEFVQYGSEGQIEGLEYDRLWTLLIPIVKQQKQLIERLEGRLAVLEQKQLETE